MLKVVSYNKYLGPYANIKKIPFQPPVKLWNQKNETCLFQYDGYGKHSGTKHLICCQIWFQGGEHMSFLRVCLLLWCTLKNMCCFVLSQSTIGTTYTPNLYDELVRFFMFSSIDPNIDIHRPTNWNKYLGHNKRWKEGGPETIGYSEAGVFRDVILVPPLSNITVSRNYVRTHSHEVCRYTQTIETKYSSMSDTCLLQSVWRRHKMNEW